MTVNRKLGSGCEYVLVWEFLLRNFDQTFVVLFKLQIKHIHTHALASK